MEWIQRLNRAMEYIEAHLEDEVNVAEAARLAACSTYHFQRMFSYLAGATLGEYIRRRRMTLAALALTGGNAKIVDLAARFGYDSPTAFNRAFQAIHGMSPTAARAVGARLTAYPPITFTLSIKGEEAMTYTIKKTGPIRVVGFRTNEPMTMEDCFEKVPLFWAQVAAHGGIPRLCALMDGSAPQGILGVSLCDGGEFSGYLIAAATQAPCPDGMAEYLIPAQTWSIFECVGPNPATLQALEKRIITEWLPTSGYEYAPAPDVEVYLSEDASASDCRSQVWLPITKKTV